MAVPNLARMTRRDRISSTPVDLRGGYDGDPLLDDRGIPRDGTEDETDIEARKQYREFVQAHEKHLRPIYNRLGYDRYLDEMSCAFLDRMKASLDLQIHDANAFSARLDEWGRLLSGANAAVFDDDSWMVESTVGLLRVRSDVVAVHNALKLLPDLPPDIIELVTVRSSISDGSWFDESALGALEEWWAASPHVMAVRSWVQDAIAQARVAMGGQAGDAVLAAVYELDYRVRYAARCCNDRASFLRKLQLDRVVQRIAHVRTAAQDEIVDISAEYLDAPWMQSRWFTGRIVSAWMSSTTGFLARVFSGDAGSTIQELSTGLFDGPEVARRLQAKSANMPSLLVGLLHLHDGTNNRELLNEIRELRNELYKLHDLVDRKMV